MIKEIQPANRERIYPEIIRPLSPEDYDQWITIAHSAWGIPVANQPWDFTALTKDNIASLGIYSGNTLKGASVNIIKVEPDGDPYLLVHMLGVQREYQNSGLGKKLMDANFALVREGRVPVQTVKLTSDPLDSRNVRLYLHKSRMHANIYLEDAYKGLASSGGSKHTGLPSDRLYYVCRPESAWVRNGILPSIEQYKTILLTGGSPLLFIETPEDLEALKNSSLDKALEYRRRQSETLSAAFLNGYTAVDHAIIQTGAESKYYIVCMKGFNEDDPDCLIRQLQ